MTTRANDEGGFLGWADLKGEPGRATPGASSPAWDATNDAWSFADNQDQELKWTMQLDHDYRQGSNVRPHVHWKPAGTSTGNVKWRLSYKWENPTASDAGSWTTITVLDAGDGEALKNQIAQFVEQSGSGKEISSLITCRVSRLGTDAEDTLVGNALLKYFDIHYQLDSTGSKQEYSKT